MMRATRMAGTARPSGRPGARWLVRRWAPLAALLMLGGLGFAPAAHARPADAPEAPGTPQLSIQRPSSGPVGAHIIGSAKSFTANHTYSLGYFLSSPLGACLTNFTAIPDASTFTIKSDGSTATFTFVWPATDTGTYYICAHDTSSPLPSYVQSSNHYVVLGTTAPAIQVAPAPSDNGTPPPAGNATYYPGSQVQVTGTNFLPGGTTVGIFYSGVQSELGTLLTSGINADTQGGFTTTVKLPDFRTGALFLHAATLDAGGGLPPSLQADTQLTVSLQPTATPTPTATAIPTATTPGGATGNSTGTSRNGSAPPIAGIIGLSSLSVLLLALGAYFLITGARARRLV